MKIKLFIIMAIVGSFFILFAIKAADYGLSDTIQATGGKLPTTVGGAANIAELAGVIVNLALSLIGIIFFGLMLYAGILWMKAMGNAEEVNKAKDIMQSAVIGLVIISAAYAISNFVFSNLAVGGGEPTAQNTGDDVQDKALCEAGTKKVWNCHGGASVKTCPKSQATCDTLCRWTYTDGECKPKNSCAAPKTTKEDLCPDDPEDVLCCYTPS